MEQVKDQIIRKKSVEALMRHAEIERMTRHVGRVSIVLFVVVLVAAAASVIFRCIGCAHN